jgi:hypothetical protein
LDLEVGDVILTGKFKNKRKVVKDFGTDDLGQPTINGTKALNFRIEKHMPKEKWSKKSKEALEFADTVAESIARRKIRKILRESWTESDDREENARMTPPKGSYAPHEDPDSVENQAARLESLINDWITNPITVELVRGTSYMIKGVEPAMIPEVTEEVEDFGGSVQAEISSGTSPGLKDLSIDLAGAR